MPLPNVRKIFIPDPGMTMFDIDLASADLRIVAWESGCLLLKQWLAEGKDPYTEVAREYYREPDMKKSDPRRQRFKSLCHATHYLGIARNIASNANIGLTVKEVERVQGWYLDLCPEIRVWQDKVKRQIRETMTFGPNVFGYRSKILKRLENDTYNKGVAWIPQSTVGILINHALINIETNLPSVQLLMQVHDSLVGQFPTNMPFLRDEILKQSEIILPYADPLLIPVGIKTSDKSWGHCG
jgi:DNA polymerase I-like protein with 3'-5' exonuclease and polymerase domains